METERDKGLKIHTSFLPASEEMPPEKPDKPRRHVFSREKKKQPSAEIAFKRSPAERLLRNTTVACALLLTVMALRRLNTPFTRSVTDALSSVISMDINLEDRLGKLSFVERLMPESALVFLNMDGHSNANLPVSGQLSHEYSASQPWTEYLTENKAPVFALKDGQISACAESSEGDWTVLVTHSDDTQAVYAFLSEVTLAPGDRVERGKSIGTTGSDENAHLYLEYRVNSEPADPRALLDEANL